MCNRSMSQWDNSSLLDMYGTHRNSNHLDIDHLDTMSNLKRQIHCTDQQGKMNSQKNQ